MGGKVVTIFYGLIGIPLFLYTMAAAGDITNYFINLLLQLIDVKWLKRQTIRNKHIKIMVIQSILMIVAILSASLATTDSLGWSYFDSIYAWFITFSTIGFGDFVPSSRISNYAQHIASLALGLTGLSIIASVINTVIDVIETRVTEGRTDARCCLLKFCCCKTDNGEEERCRDINVETELAT